MYDAIIVGGRCAGASTAIWLAQRGYSVLLLDRDDHPSHTLSTHSFGDLELLETLGVLQEIADGAPRMTRFRTDINGCVLEGDLVVTPWASGMTREKLDSILINKARSFPTVTWMPRTVVTDLIWQNGAVAGVVAQPRDGQAFTARAGVVVGADGRHSFVARRVGAAEYVSAAEFRCAYYAYYENVQSLPIPAFEFYWAGEDVAQVQPCDGGLHCVCLMPRQEEFDQWRHAPEAMFEERLRLFRNLTPRLAEARRTSPVRGSGSLRSFIKEAYGPGWALVGDAGICTHPIHGAGIDAALFSAQLLADALHQVFQGEARWAEAMAAFQTARDKRMRSTLDYARRVAELPALAAEQTGLLRLLCSITALGYDLGGKIEGVLSLLRGEQALAGLKALAASAGEPEPGRETVAAD